MPEMPIFERFSKLRRFVTSILDSLFETNSLREFLYVTLSDYEQLT